MKTVWIIDASYLMKAAPGHFDYLKLKAVIEQQVDSSFEESYYLNSTPNPPTDQQDAFHTWLKTAPPKGPQMRLRLYKLKEMSCNCPECGNTFDRQVQKGVDVGIGTLLIKLAVQGKYDRVVLSAGDGDFEDAVEYIKDELGKEFHVAGFNGSISADLQSYANKIVWLDQIWSSIKR